MISCDRHDYIEIACLYHFSVELTLKNGTVLLGVAQDTLVTMDKQEGLRLSISEHHSEVIVLSELLSMRAVVDNPYFEIIHF